MRRSLEDCYRLHGYCRWRTFKAVGSPYFAVWEALASRALSAIWDHPEW